MGEGGSAVEGLMQRGQMQRGELRFLPLRFIENIILNVFPGDEGLQEVPPTHRVLKCLHTSNPIHCSSLHGQLSAGVEERGGVGRATAKKCVRACARVCVYECMEG